MEKPETLIATVDTLEQADEIRKAIVWKTSFLWPLVMKNFETNGYNIFVCNEFFGKITEDTKKKLDNLVEDITSKWNNEIIELDDGLVISLDENISTESNDVPISF